MLPHYSGAPGARGPRFIEPPEPPVPTPLLTAAVLFRLLLKVKKSPFSNSLCDSIAEYKMQ